MDIPALIGTVLTALGLERLVIYLLERRARGRQAMGEARKAEAEAGKIAAESEVIHADAEAKTLSSAFLMIDRLENHAQAADRRIDEQERKINDQERKFTRIIRRYAQRIEYLMNGIRILLGQMENHCIEPEWKPDEFTIDEDLDDDQR